MVVLEHWQKNNIGMSKNNSELWKLFSTTAELSFFFFSFLFFFLSFLFFTHFVWN